MFIALYSSVSAPAANQKFPTAAREIRGSRQLSALNWLILIIILPTIYLI
jgi:hypothetical protein